MSYESPDYGILTGEIRRLENIRKYVDLARDFEHMKYAGRMTISTVPKDGLYETHDNSRSIDLPDYLKAEVINAAIAWCLKSANTAARIESRPFDIEAAAKV